MTTKTSAKTLHKPHTSHGLLAYLKKAARSTRDVARCPEKPFPYRRLPFQTSFRGEGETIADAFLCRYERVIQTISG